MGMQTRRQFLKSAGMAGGVLVLSLLPGRRTAAAGRRRPKIVFILADDLGYGDLGCYGRTDIKTPVLDGMAADGVRFTQCYANGPECTPTRTATSR